MPRIIYVDSIFLKRTINSNIKITNKKFIIIPKKKFIYFSFFFLKNLNSIILFLKSYFLTIIFSKKKIDYNFKNITLIDTFIRDEKKQETDFYGNLYKKYIKPKKNIFFVPTNIYSDFFSFIKIIKKLDTNKFLLKEHFLNFKDLLFCVNHLSRKKNFIKNIPNTTK